MDNILLMTDSYKVTHWKQYKPGTQKVYSYFESRGGKFPKTVFFGLQYFIERYLTGKVVTKRKIQEAKEFFKLHFGTDTLFNEAGWEYIRKTYKGHLPVIIKAVPEGSVVDVSNVLVTIENTDPNCFWLTNYLETLLVQTWYPTTVATQSYYIKKMITEYAKETGDPSLVGFKLHDFGFRGVSSPESAGIGGCAHLVNFMGTDTIEALVTAKKYYNCDMAGFSIPASEHSTITSWGKDNEAEAMENMLVQYPNGLVACVSDSFDIYNACENIWGDKLKDKILSRDGTLVIRPDSGTPELVVLKVLNILGNKFGTTTNEKGYKVLNNKVRIIQGDGVNYDSINAILGNMKLQKWSTDNIAFGIGGALLQNLNRDTQSFAFKCSSTTVDGVEHDVFKQPVTDEGKKSKAGRLQLVKSDVGYLTYNWGKNNIDELVPVFENGRVLKHYTLDEIRKRAII